MDTLANGDIDWINITGQAIYGTNDGCNTPNGSVQLSGNDFLGTSIGQNVPLSQGTPYNLQFCAKNIIGAGPYFPGNIQVRAINSSTLYNYANCTSPNCQIIYETTGLDVNWENFCIKNFVPLQDFDMLVFQVTNGYSTDDEFYFSTVLLDDVCLQYSYFCGNDIVIDSPTNVSSYSSNVVWGQHITINTDVSNANTNYNSIDFIATDYINLLPGFEGNANTYDYINAAIAPCNNAPAPLQNTDNPAAMKSADSDVHLAQNLRLAILPNPTDNVTQLSVIGEQYQHIRLEILDINGREMIAPISYKFAESSLYTLQLSTKDWTNGVYFVKCSNDDGTFAVQKLVVNH
ncbi:MAG: T9SS type A sorting domain-containing protein [Chitinophagales bacterium]|nr:T9SS type A sorting domain-containing protein [Bacteroidota bacterium]MCB9043225.1 T9SS type A sorting domain-containing protein [Chitinophagales bacterium]